MKEDIRSRKWQLTINNPEKSGYDHAIIKVLLGDFGSLVYWCMSDEVGEGGTPHTHVFLASSNAIRFSTIKNKFATAHIEIARGTSEQNRQYIRKEGRWEKDKKKETSLPETFEEWGDMPVERQGVRNDLHDLYDMIKSDMSNFEIMENNPEYMMKIDKIERARQIIKENRFKSTFRPLKVTYVCGATGTGKTRHVMEKYGYDKVFRVTDYKNPFDGYAGQDVVIFEEFRSSMLITDMLNLLDGYPLELPCRYSNKIACFTQVFIITNINLNEQYKNVQQEYPETWSALLRRIHIVRMFDADGSIFEYDLAENNYGIWEIPPAEKKKDKLPPEQLVI